MIDFGVVVVMRATKMVISENSTYDVQFAVSRSDLCSIVIFVETTLKKPSYRDSMLYSMSIYVIFDVLFGDFMPKITRLMLIKKEVDCP